MNYIFSASWFLIGIYLLYQGHKTHRVFYVLGSYFIFLGGWWLTNQLIEINLMDGIYGIILRVISAIMLVIALMVYYRAKKKKKDNNA
ncbi:MAG TPA: hypothetical protein GX401_08240 [Clostridiales bacterium]|nr:hypothetical protein [Clostridiales bacterium]